MFFSLLDTRKPTGNRFSLQMAVLFGFAAILALFSGTGCDVKPESAGHGHSHSGTGGHGGDEHEGHGGHGDHGDGHGPGGPTRKVTTFGDRTELFVEFPALVVGETAEFFAHVTALEDYAPASGGSVAVVLTSDDAPGERFEADHPIRGGLYVPHVEPEHAGKRKVFIVYRAEETTERFNLGTVTVHEEKPDDVDFGGESPEGISFSKEQQWKVEFGTGLVETHTLRESVPAQGFIRPAPDAKASIRAPFAGRVLSVGTEMPDVGDDVEAGDPVAVVAPTVDANVLPSLQAELARAKTELKRRKRRVKRLESLVEQGAMPRERLLDAKSDLESAEAAVDASRKRLGQFRSFKGGGRGAALTLRAPTSGKVVERSVTAGEYAERGVELLKIVDRRRLRLEARIAEANLDEVESVAGGWFETDEGEVVELGGSDDTFIGHVGLIDDETRTSSAWFEIPAADESVAPGQYVRAHVWTGGGREAPAIPSTAILEEKGLSVVYVMAGPETFERRVVRTGIRDGGWVEILQGLEPGERVVTRGAYVVKLASATSGVAGHHH